MSTPEDTNRRLVEWKRLTHNGHRNPHRTDCTHCDSVMSPEEIEQYWAAGIQLAEPAAEIDADKAKRIYEEYTRLTLTSHVTGPPTQGRRDEEVVRADGTRGSQSIEPESLSRFDTTPRSASRQSSLRYRERKGVR
jgi:hypothetical protein